MSPQAGVKTALQTERGNCDCSLWSKTWQFFQNKRAHLYSGKSWFLSSVRVGSNTTFLLTLAGRQAESRNPYDPQWSAWCIQSGAAQVDAPPQAYYWMSVHALLPPQSAKVADSSLLLQLLRLSERKKTEQQGIYRVSKLLFSHSITSIKSRDFAPHCCQADDGCLRALFTHWNINTVCRVS